MKKDELFWQKLTQGDKAAVKEIFQLNIPLLLKYGHRFTNNAQVIDECIVNVFLDLWKQRLSFQNKRSVKIYLLETLRKKIELKQKGAQLKRA